MEKEIELRKAAEKYATEKIVYIKEVRGCMVKHNCYMHLKQVQNGRHNNKNLFYLFWKEIMKYVRN